MSNSQIGEPRPAPAHDLSPELARPHLSLVKTSAAPAAPAPAGEPIPLVADRAALVAALRVGDARAAAAFFFEFEPLVGRTIGRILGFGDDLPDATQEAFLRAMRSLGRLRNPQALVDWLQQIAVFTAVDFLRRRKRRRWLRLLDHEAAEEPSIPGPDAADQEAVRATYRVLDRMSPDERSVFALRFIDGMEIDALASAHDCSRSTIKRRLARSTARFRALAQREAALAPWLAGSELEEESTL